MSIKQIGWCRITEELVLDTGILDRPYLRDDMDVYSFNGRVWAHWTPEKQGYCGVCAEEVPEVVQVAMMMLS